jgi:hypothetical protein
VNILKLAALRYRYFLITVAVLLISVLYVWQGLNAWASQDQTYKTESAIGVRGLMAGRNVDSRELTGMGVANGAMGTLYYYARGNIGVLILQDMPILPPSQIYEMWVVDEAGRIDPSSVFRVPVDSEGVAVVDVSTPRMLSTYTRLFVTIEQASGSLTPSDRVVMRN